MQVRTGKLHLVPVSNSPSPSPEFLALFRQRANAAGAMTFAEFMELALYDPQLGYYRRDRTRVGYGAGTDFYTASTSGEIFGEMIAAACVDLLGAEDPRSYTFVEIGAESDAGVLAGVNHPFGELRTVRVGGLIELSGRCVVFSNELFDAQPFHRYVARDGAWHELGVATQQDELHEIELPLARAPASLPPSPADGYVFDAPFASVQLLQQIARQSWTGLFAACDYGKSLRELAEGCPAGTARAYHRHRQSNDLLAQPGEQDLTCHVCWDWLVEALATAGFESPQVDSQEAFFVRHAGAMIAAATAAEAARLSQRKLALLQLLHPSHLGQKFQVLHALRR